MKRDKRTLAQAKRCLEVVASALLKCPYYDYLRSALEIHTNLSKIQVWRVINEYIPYLSKLNPNVDVEKWLPQTKIYRITYDNCVKLGQDRDVLEFDMTRNEFKTAMDNRGLTVPSKVKLRWRCRTNHNHIWFATYNDIKSSESGCPHCFGNYPITYEDCVKLGQEREDLEFDMIRSEFKKAMDNRGTTTLSQVKLNWRCTTYFHHTWDASYNDIKSSGYGCRHCAEIYGFVGKQLHKVIQYIITTFFLRLGLKIYSEVTVSINKKNKKKTRIVDSFLLNINNKKYLMNRLFKCPRLLKEIRLEESNFDKIEAFMFDYTKIFLMKISRKNLVNIKKRI